AGRRAGLATVGQQRQQRQPIAGWREAAAGDDLVQRAGVGELHQARVEVFEQRQILAVGCGAGRRCFGRAGPVGA
ncbi:MAG: hypothetical protein RLZZ300_2009, partial [Pseudomonadota bacterium]